MSPTNHSHSELVQIATTGDIDAIRQLAVDCLYKKNWAERWKWLSLGATQDDPLCIYLIGESYLEGVGNPIDQSEGIRYIELAADHEMGLAQFKLYQHFSAIAKNTIEIQQALKWLELASSNQTYPCGEAKYEHASLLLDGKVISQNVALGVSLLNELIESDQDDYGASSTLANIYLKGIGGYYQPTKGVELLRLASDQNWSDAKYRLGRLYALGLHLDVDKREAVNLWHEGYSDISGGEDEYTLACAFAYAKANQIGFGIKGELSEAISAYQFGAAAGDADACFELAQICIERCGDGFEDPYGELTLTAAYRDLNIACALGHPESVALRQQVGAKLSTEELHQAQSESRIQFDASRIVWEDNWRKLIKIRQLEPLPI